MLRVWWVMLQDRLRNRVRSAAEVLRAFRDYLIGTGRLRPVRDFDDLVTFVDSRASHVAQTSLYGYLRTRAGTLYPELFANDPFMVSVNIAKWQMWLACVSDLSVYAGGMLLRRCPDTPESRIRTIMGEAVETILQQAGEPAEGGNAFSDNAALVRDRIGTVDWTAVDDGESHFTWSPEALVTWTPIVEGLKELDREIVTNSVRFRWQEVRRDLRRVLDARAVIATAPGPSSAPGAVYDET